MCNHKPILAVILVFITLSLSSLALDEGVEQGFGEETPQQKQVTESIANPSDNPVEDLEIEEPIVVQPPPGGIFVAAKLPQGSMVTSNEDGFSASAVDNMDFEGDNALTDAKGVEVGSDGNVKAASVSNFNQGSDFGGQNLEGFSFDFDANLLTISRGSNLVFTKPYPIEFPEVGPSTFEVTSDGALVRWDVKYPSDGYAYTWKNPLTLGITVEESGQGIIGAATNFVRTPSEVLDEFMRARGDEGDVFKGDNENYTGNKPFSSITFTIGGNSSFSIAGGAGKVFEATPLDDAFLTGLTFHRSDEKSYLISTFNAVIYFYGEEFIERAKAESLSFRMDINEGLYSHLIFSPGSYRYSFRRLKKYEAAFALVPLKHWAQSYEIERPEGEEWYDLAIDKETRISPYEEYQFLARDRDNAGYASMYNEHRVFLKGVVNYKRKGFTLGNYAIQGPNGMFFDILAEPSPRYYPIIESLDSSNILDIKLQQKDNIFASADVYVYPVEEGKTLYKAHFDDAIVYEVAKEGVTKQFIGWEDIGTPATLMELTTTHEPVYQDFQRGIMVLRTGNTKFYSEKDDSMEKFLYEMEEYQKDFQFCEEVVTPHYFKQTGQQPYTIVDWAKE